MTFLDLLYWIVDRAIDGMGPFASAEAVAEVYRRQFPDPEQAIDALIEHELVKIGTSGFLMGLPGAMALPVTIPVSLGADYLLSARVAAAIAVLRGWDVRDPSVRTFVVLSLIGSKGKDAVKGAVAAGGARVARNVAGRASARAVPIVGGVIGSSLDCTYLFFVARASKEFFKSMHPEQVEDDNPLPGRRGFRPSNHGE